MSMVVWVMMGIAIWHFMVFVPDSSGAGSWARSSSRSLGAVVFGFLVAGLTVPGQNDTDIEQGLIAVPGALIALGISWLYGSRQEARQKRG